MTAGILEEKYPLQKSRAPWSRKSQSRRSYLIAIIAITCIILYYLRNNATYTFSQVQSATKFHQETFSVDDYKPRFPSEFPKNIWQTGSAEMGRSWAEKIDTWKNQNRGWNYEFLTDASNTEYVEKHFQDRPHLLAFWNELNTTILRADMIRYLTMLGSGGVYSDVDTSCLEPISSWIPSGFKEHEINAVVGVEYDDTTYKMFVRPVSFSQWTLMSKPGHPLFEAVIKRVVYHLEYLARIQATTLSKVKLGKKEVLEATGPGAFTDAVMEILTENMGRHVEWSEVQGLKAPKVFGDVLVLPIRAFGSGQKHSHGQDPAYGTALALHHFGRSWYTSPAAPEAKKDPKASPTVPANNAKVTSKDGKIVQKGDKKVPVVKNDKKKDLKQEAIDKKKQKPAPPAKLPAGKKIPDGKAKKAR